MFWTKKPPFCDLILHTADTETRATALLVCALLEGRLARRPSGSQGRQRISAIT